MTKIVLATQNTHKVIEIRQILKDLPVQLLSLDDFPNVPDVIEDKDSFEGNALKKAREIFDFTGLPSIADDSGLEVEALNGDPGILSARFSGKDATDLKNNQKLLGLLTNIPLDKRDAQFRCVAAFINSDQEHLEEGICKGTIINDFRGNQGFGYDPLFYLQEFEKTMAELSEDEKNSISHRGKAFKKMTHFLEGLIKSH